MAWVFPSITTLFSYSATTLLWSFALFLIFLFCTSAYNHFRFSSSFSSLHSTYMYLLSPVIWSSPQFCYHIVCIPIYLKQASFPTVTLPSSPYTILHQLTCLDSLSAPPSVSYPATNTEFHLYRSIRQTNPPDFLRFLSAGVAVLIAWRHPQRTLFAILVHESTLTAPLPPRPSLLSPPPTPFSPPSNSPSN